MSENAGPMDLSKLDASTTLAADRTRLAVERTMLAWIRTATALITFGFGVAKFSTSCDQVSRKAITNSARPNLGS